MPELFAAYVAFLITIGVLVAVIRAKDAEMQRREEEAIKREVLAEDRFCREMVEARQGWSERCEELREMLRQAQAERRELLAVAFPDLAPRVDLAGVPQFPPGDEGMWLREQMRSEEGRNSPEVKRALDGKRLID